jgi:hypothetical protein
MESKTFVEEVIDFANKYENSEGLEAERAVGLIIHKLYDIELYERRILDSNRRLREALEYANEKIDWDKMPFRYDPVKEMIKQTLNDTGV